MKYLAVEKQLKIKIKWFKVTFIFSLDFDVLGHLDTDLSAIGLEQARDIRALINQSKPDIIISSDLKRARYVSYWFSWDNCLVNEKSDLVNLLFLF